ncbi:PaaI family thioesterase [Prolixibacteraceae bacterium JC049]|nr:PaaI family thioesterase [Prolixibacteraceae bacterium JC049]
MEQIPNIDINTPIEMLNAVNQNTLMGQLGIEYTAVDEQSVTATMPVDKRTTQPMGILHGGANLALAETIAGLGSALYIDLNQFTAVGSQVAANHIGTATSGLVTAKATIIHQGRRTHVWNVDICNDQGDLISSCRVTNMIIER